MRIIKIIQLLIISLMLSVSCKKDSNSSKNSMQFTFTGNIISFGDIIIEQNQTITSGSGEFDFFIKQTGGEAEDITLTISGLPTGVAFSPSLPQTYVASLFNLNTETKISLVSLSANSSVAGGNYPIVITAKTASGVAKSINFNLTVQTCNVTETSIVGIYNGNWKLAGVNFATDKLTISDSANNRVSVQSLFYNTTFKATLSGLSLESDSIIIPSATTSLGTFTNVRAKATGTFDCAINPLNITLQVAKGSVTLTGSSTISIAGQTLIGVFNK